MLLNHQLNSSWSRVGKRKKRSFGKWCSWFLIVINQNGILICAFKSPVIRGGPQIFRLLAEEKGIVNLVCTLSLNLVWIFARLCRYSIYLLTYPYINISKWLTYTYINKLSLYGIKKSLSQLFSSISSSKHKAYTNLPDQLENCFLLSFPV